MACMGPNHDYAKQQAKQASKEILELLVNKYKIASPCKGPFFNDFIAARDKIEQGIEDLFIADANDSF